MNAKLVYPGVEHQSMMKAYLKETFEYGESFVNGDGGCHQFDDYFEWLKREKQNHLGIYLKPGYVPGTTYFYIKDDMIVGTINIRHCLNENLINVGGHIGYSVLPSQRRKGYATAMLKEAIQICKKWDIDPILVTCDKNNIASRKTIEKCGGQLENEYYDKQTNKTTLRFWIGERK